MIYYSHVNEDNRIERQLLSEASAKMVVAVAGSGERIIALMDRINCNTFHVVDVNEEALFLLQLKLAALGSLTIDEYYQFCGHFPSTTTKRKDWFNVIKHKLSPASRAYWEKNQLSVEKGILVMGHFEKFLLRVNPLVHLFLGGYGRKLCEGNSAQDKKFPIRRWNLLMWLFSRRWVYRLMGNRDVAFISKDATIGHIPVALEEIISNDEAASCFMTHLIFKGHLRDMQEGDLPPSLQREVLERIKLKLALGMLDVEYHRTDMLTFIERERKLLSVPVFYSLSDILSFEPFSYLDKLLNLTVSPGNAIVWRAFLRHRYMDNHILALTQKYKVLTDYSRLESTRMYQVYGVHATTAKT